MKRMRRTGRILLALLFAGVLTLPQAAVFAEEASEGGYAEEVQGVETGDVYTEITDIPYAEIPLEQESSSYGELPEGAESAANGGGDVLLYGEFPDETESPPAEEMESLSLEGEAQDEVAAGEGLTSGTEPSEGAQISKEGEADRYKEDPAPSILIQNMDFSSKRIIVASKDPSIPEGDPNLLSSYQDSYLLQFEEEEEAKRAYLYYFNKAELVEVDNGIQIADAAGESVRTETKMTEEENPFADLMDQLSEEQAKKDEAEQRGEAYAEPEYDIALIDTGVSEESGIARISFLGEDGLDDNGHGTAMAQAILSQNPNAHILSLKALDKDGKGDISAVYAALEYAIGHGIPVINLSVSARASQKNSILEETIRRKISESEEEKIRGITVVGAAGNSGKNVKYYVPGNISDALIVGAAAADGTHQSFSNWGETVDYEVVADSTSKAAAITSGFLSLYGEEAIEAALGQGLFYAAFREEPETETGTDWERELPAAAAEDSFEINAVSWNQSALEIPYGSSAPKISDRIPVDEDAFDNKLPLFSSSQITRHVANAQLKPGYIWQDATQSYRQVYYFEIPSGLKSYASAAPKIRYFTADLNILVTVKATYSNKGQQVMPECAFFYPDAFQIGFGETIYTNQNGTVAISEINGLPLQAYSVQERLRYGLKDYVGFHVDVFKGATNTRLSDYPDVFSGITDIDEGQSFRRLNGDPFTRANSIIRNKTAFDEDVNGSGLFSRFAENDASPGTNAFFSPVTLSGDTPITFSSPGQANVYSKIRRDPSNNSKSLLATEGLDYSFGWSKEAGSTIELFVPAGGLKIKKNNVSVNTAALTVNKAYTAMDEGKVFSYTLQLQDAGGNPLSGSFALHRYYPDGTEYNSGSSISNGGAINIRTGWKAVISGLPAGTKCILKEYLQSGSQRDETGNEETVQVANNNNLNQFRFYVTIKNGNSPVDGLRVKLGGALSGAKTTNEEGKIAIDLSPGQTVSLKAIPLGYKCTVEERDYSARNYQAVSSTNTAVTIAADTLPTSVWTNRYNPPNVEVTFPNDKAKLTVETFPYDYSSARGVINISKTVAGTGADPSKEFEFTLTSIQPAEGQTLQYRRYRNGSWESNLTNIAQGGKIRLKHGERARIYYAEPGSAYEITETGAAAYYPNRQVFTGDVPEIVTEGSSGQRFRYTITLKKANGTPVGAGYHLYNEKGTVVKTTDANSQVTFVGYGGSSYTFYGLDNGYQYTVTQEALDEGRTVLANWSTASSGESGTVTLKGAKSRWRNVYTLPEALVRFVNTTKTGSVAVTKMVEGSGADANKSFSFNLTLKAGSTNLSGTYPYSVNGVSKGTVTFTDGAATLSLKGGETAVIEEIPNAGNVRFSAAEAADSAYQITQVNHRNQAAGQNLLRGTAGVEMVETNGVWEESTWGKNNVDTSSAIREAVAVSDFPFQPYLAGGGIRLRKTAATSAGMNVTQRKIPVEGGKPYILSWWAKGTGELLAFAGFSTYASKAQTLSNTWKRYEMEFVPGEGQCALSEDGMINVAFGIRAAVVGCDITIADLRLEKKAESTFVNTRKTGSFSVSKTVEGTSEKDPFTFELTLKDGAAKMSGAFPYTINGEDRGLLTFENGSASLVLKGGETAVVEGIPDSGNVQYSASEVPNPQYNTQQEHTSGSIGQNLLSGTVNVQYREDENGSRENGTWGDGVSEQKDYEEEGVLIRRTAEVTDFPYAPYTGKKGILITKNTTAGVDGGNGTALVTQAGVPVESGKTYTLSVWAKKDTGTSGKLTFAYGKSPLSSKSFTLSEGWKKYSVDLVPGVDTSVSEGTIHVMMGYAASETGTMHLADMRLEEKKEASFVNTFYPTGHRLSVEKTVTGNLGNKEKRFHFTLTLDSDQTQPVTYVKGSESGTVSFEGRQFGFELSHGEKIVFTGIRDNTGYQVTEEEANRDGYTTSASAAEGSLTSDVSVRFTNRKNMQVPTSVKIPLYGGLSLVLGGILLLTGYLIRRRRADGRSRG